MRCVTGLEERRLSCLRNMGPGAEPMGLSGWCLSLGCVAGSSGQLTREAHIKQACTVSSLCNGHLHFCRSCCSSQSWDLWNEGAGVRQRQLGLQATRHSKASTVLETWHTE